MRSRQRVGPIYQKNVFSKEARRTPWILNYRPRQLLQLSQGAMDGIYGSWYFGSGWSQLLDSIGIALWIYQNVQCRRVGPAVAALALVSHDAHAESGLDADVLDWTQQIVQVPPEV
jgi:hypothetical protein